MRKLREILGKTGLATVVPTETTVQEQDRAQFFAGGVRDGPLKNRADTDPCAFNSNPESPEKNSKKAEKRPPVMDTPVVGMVDALIRQAVSEEASDIHIEPSAKGLRIRRRIDGILHDFMASPGDIHPLVVSRIKIMANLDIAERRLPQDGRINFQAETKDVNLRVSTMPTIQGEKVVIRILDRNKIILPLENLGFSGQNFQKFKDFLQQSTGMILITGPTGCGKTTTLYSMLNYLNNPRINIISVEDPVEYRLDGVNQVQVNQRIGITFAGALRSILRQDPNIIMVGEIRDPETAEMVIRAALTGHLVLSTLHTSSAAHAITRLADMGAAPYLISASLVGVVAQRLVRLVCSRCRREYPLSTDEKHLFQNKFGRVLPDYLTRGAGCGNCNNTGYRGRTVLHEIIMVNREIRGLITEGAPAEILHEKAQEGGMTTLLGDGLSHVEKGNTTLEEVMRVVFNTAADGALTLNPVSATGEK